MIVLLTSDLMIQSSAVAAAKTQGVSIVAVPTIDAAIGKLASLPVRALFVDLQAAGLQIPELAMRLATVPNRPLVIAFAQHVETALLQLAKTEAIDHVLTRGQFSGRLPDLIKQAVGTGAPENVVSDRE